MIYGLPINLQLSFVTGRWGRKCDDILMLSKDSLTLIDACGDIWAIRILHFTRKARLAKYVGTHKINLN